MYILNCNACDFNAKSTLTPKLSKCPSCNTLLIIKEKKAIDIEIPKPVNQPFSIDIDGCQLEFKEVLYNEDEECLDYSSKDVEKITKSGFIFRENYIDQEAYSLAVLAKALNANASFLKKVEFLKNNFSREQINILNLKYTTNVRQKYDPLLQEELTKLMDSTEMQLAQLEEIENREKEIRKRAAN